MQKLGDLTNAELLARLQSHVGKGHVWQARLIEYLAEVEERRLDREHACSSIWDFCVRKLRMSEGEAHRRIAAARVIRQFPLALAWIEEGKVHLSAIYALRDHLTDENHEELLREAIGKTTREVQRMIAARFPRPDVPTSVEPVQPQTDLPVVLPHATDQNAPSTAGSLAGEQRPRIEPLSATRYRVEVTVSAEINAKLERIKDLMRHRNPTGDLETILDASLGLLLAKLEKERLGKTSRPRRGRSAETKMHGAEDEDTRVTDHHADGVVGTAPTEVPEKAETRRTPAKPRRGTAKTRRDDIAAEVRRQVFARDGEQCSYVDAEGNRCPARGFLELDHIHPKAFGGNDDVANLRVRCRPHNQHYAEQVFGREHVQARIHFRQRKYQAPPTASFDTAARGLRSLGFREPEVRRALRTLETELGKEASVETIIRDALLLLT